MSSSIPIGTFLLNGSNVFLIMIMKTNHILDWEVPDRVKVPDKPDVLVTHDLDGTIFIRQRTYHATLPSPPDFFRSLHETYYTSTPTTNFTLVMNNLSRRKTQ